MPASSLAFALVALVYPKVNSGKRIAEALDKHGLRLYILLYTLPDVSIAQLRSGNQHQVVWSILTMDLPTCITYPLFCVMSTPNQRKEE